MPTSIDHNAQPLSVILPVSVNIEADWRQFFKNGTKAVADFFLKNPSEAGAGGVGALIDLVSSIRIERTPGNLLWMLNLTATAWSLSKAVTVTKDVRIAAVDEIKSYIKDISEEIRSTGIEVPHDFLSRPSRLPIFEDLSARISDRIANLSQLREDQIRQKIAASFSLAIYEISLKKSEIYAPLINHLSGPRPIAALIENSWNHYRAKLIHDFEVKSLFGQEREQISLSQLYVPLRGTWQDSTLETSDDIYSIDSSRRIVLVEDTLSDWIEKGAPDDWLRLIGGGPGSGKSTTLKSLARKYADDPCWRPLFIPLQHIEIERDLREAIDSHFLRMTDASFVEAPLSREAIEDGPPILLIFDGLDELAAPGEAAKDVVATFANRLHNLYTSLAGAQRKTIRIIVSGRMPAFQAATRYLPTDPSAAIETYGFLPNEVQAAESGDDLWLVDQRKKWWNLYAEAKGEDPDIPEAFSSERLQGITNEPLLCYLLALSGYANNHWELAADNRNRIYAALIESIYDRGWGDGDLKRLGPGRTLSKSDFVKLMETIALAAWLGGDNRVASTEKFEETISFTNAETAWDAFTRDNGQDIANLAMNFYLKSSDKKERGFEFTHKSFGEYLTAKALISIAKEIVNISPKRCDVALQDFLKATKNGKSSLEILSFLRDEFRLLDSERELQKKIKAEFEKLISIVNDEGFPPYASASTWRDLEQEQVNAENALWMIANSIAFALSDINSPVYLSIEWRHNEVLSDVIRRLSKFTDSPVIFNCLSHLDASSQTLTAHRFLDVDFRSSNLSRATFIGCSIDGDFFNANLEKSRFYQCVIDGVVFRDCNFTEVAFHACLMRSCDFSATEFRNTSMSPLTFVTNITSTWPSDLKGLLIMVGAKNDKEKISKSIDSMTKIMMRQKQKINRGLVGDGL